jgi:hypothetical protein
MRCAALAVCKRLLLAQLLLLLVLLLLLLQRGAQLLLPAGANTCSISSAISCVF